MDLYLRNFLISEVLTAGEATVTLSENRLPADAIFTGAVTRLKDEVAELNDSVVYHEQKGLTEEADSVDGAFNGAFVEFRSLAELQGKVTSLGQRSKSSADIAAIISRIDRELHMKSKDVQITLASSLIAECESGDNPLADSSGLRQPFNLMKKLNDDLKAIQAQRKVIDKESDKISAPSVCAEKVRDTLAVLHNHLQNGVNVNIEGYEETLEEFYRTLAPRVTAVKSRMTRKENEQEA